MLEAMPLTGYRLTPAVVDRTTRPSDADIVARKAARSTPPGISRRAVGRVRPHLSLLLLSLAALTFINVSRAHYMMPWLAKLHPGQLLFGSAVLFMLLDTKRVDARNLVRSWPARSVFAFAGLAVLSAIFGISVGGSARFLIDNYSKTLIYTALLLVALRNVRDLHTIVWSIFWGCCVLAYQAIFMFGLENAGNFARLANLFDMDPNDIGCVLAIGIPLSLLLLQNERKIWRPVILLCIGGMMVTVARSGSRGTFVAMIMMAVMLLIMARGLSVSRRVAIIVGSGVAIAVAAPRGYWAQMATIAHIEQDYNFTAMDGRKELIRRGLGYMAMYPVFGIGISNFQKAECSIVDPKRVISGDTPNCTAPHNSFIQIASELGVPGGLLWIALLGGGCVWMLVLRERVPRKWSVGTPEEKYLLGVLTYLPVAIVGFAVSSLFVSFAYASPVYILLAMMAVTTVEVRKRLRATATRST